MEDEDFYYPGMENDDGSKLGRWMKLYFRQRKMAYLLSTVVLAGLAWWANNWFAPVFFLLVAYVVVRIMRQYGKTGSTMVIEVRIQGEVIKHCRYFQQKIQVPNTSLQIHMVPNSRLKDVKAYGDSTPPVQTHNIVVVDYYEALPNGDIIWVYPEDVNFSNFAMYGRINPDLVTAMHEVGGARMANDEFKEYMVEMYHSGRFGEGYVAQEKLRSMMLDVARVEEKLSKSAAANRSLWMYYKNTIPSLHKEVLMLQQELPRLAMHEAAKLVHVLHNHPMGEATYERIESLLGDGTIMDFDSRFSKLIEDHGGQDDTSVVKRSAVEGDVYRMA